MIRVWLIRLGNLFEKAAWAAMLIALPVTSFPYFPKAIGGEALVRPLSLYPLSFLIPFSILPKIIRKPLPKNLLVLMVFTLVAISSSVLSLFRGIEPALGISVESRILRGLSTLLIGCAFFLAIALLPETSADLRFSLRWIYAGIAIAMTWGSLQAVNILHPQAEFFAFLERVQSKISMRKLLYDRISGMTYEPHWFAEQIILLLLPYSLAAILNDYTVFRFRWRRLTVEWILLGWAVLLLPFTFSRAGLINLVVVIVVVIFLFHPKNSRNHSQNRWKPGRKTLFARLQELGMICIVLLIILTPIYLIGNRNPFFARIWSYWRNPQASLQGYFSHLGIDPRIVYAQTAFNIYKEHPLLGVGLGNYAFYFEENLPYRPIADVTEVLLMVTPELGRDRLITSKNFFLRLLAETGIVGWIAFYIFLLINVVYALYLWLSPDKEWKYWGTASLGGMVAFVLSALSFDSFVIPDIWVLLGFITAATRIATRTEKTMKEDLKINHEPTLETARRTV